MEAMKKYGRIVVFGASSGIGLEVSKYLVDQCEELITVSRRKPSVGKWIQTDVSDIGDIEKLSQELKDLKIDGLLYLGGTWEEHAFTADYSFEDCSEEEIENVLSVNLLAPIQLIRKLMPNLRKSDNAKIIIIGAAIGGLNLNAGKEVSNTSSKFGLRGLVFSLRHWLKKDRIGISLIDPGNVATQEVLGDLESNGLDESHAIPLADMFASIEYVLNLSNRTNVNQIDMPTML